jgi:hypothetical protein
MKSVVETIGGSPWAVVIGLILSALPILIPITRASWKTLKTLYGFSRRGIERQLRVQFFRRVRLARRLIPFERLVVYLFTRTAFFVMFSTMTIIYVITATLYLNVKYEQIVEDPITSLSKSSVIAGVGIGMLICYNVFVAVESKSIGRLLKLRRKLMCHASRRQSVESE